MSKGKPLSRDILDKAFPDNPVGIVHVSMHGAVMNSKAIESFGYKDGMPTPAGGVIVRKADGKSLQGLVMETAYLPMYLKQPGVTPESELAAAKAGQQLYAAAGVTTAQEGSIHLAQIGTFQRIAKAGGFVIDVVAYPFFTDIDAITKTTPFTAWGKYDSPLKIGGCKITADGSPQGKTAWFTTPYLTGGPAGEKDWKGEAGFAVADMQKAEHEAKRERALLHGAKLVGRRSHARGELEQRLARRDGDDAARDAVDRLSELGAVDDVRHAANLIEHRLAKGWGPARIEHDLSVAGLDDTLIRTTLADVDDEQIDAAARIALGTRVDAEGWQRLAARGFDESVAERLLGLPDVE
jgi:SOS response regulatory protein OraA/RecX